MRRRSDLSQCYDGLAAIDVDGVQVHFLAPDFPTLSKFKQSYFSKLTDPATEEPEYNQLSVVIALHYAGNVVLLGADALKKN